MTLSGKRALVTGGGSGLGAAIAVALAEAGSEVFVSGRRASALEEISARSERISPIVADVTNEDSLREMFAEIAKGGAPDIVIANAGAAESAPFHRTDRELWQRMLDVNLTGVFLTFQAAMPLMKTNPNGRLIAIASTAGLKGYSYMSAYTAAKHGVVGLVRALAHEVATTGLTVNAICPSFTETPMLERSIENIIEKTGKSREYAMKALSSGNPQGRFIRPEEVAGTVLWLCGVDAGSVTGQAISISGGEI